MKIFLLAIAVIAVSPFVLKGACGDGLASETLAPEMIGSANVTLSIGTLPFTIDTNHTGTQLNIVLVDTRTMQPIPYATLAISAFKGQGPVFEHTFQSDSGNFILRFYPSFGETTYNETGNVPGNSSNQNSGYYEIRGPVFNSGGLYRFKIDVLTMNSYSNQVSGPYVSGISIPEYDNLTINDPTYGMQQIQIVGYYDQLHDIRYDQARKSINFTMPFDWSESNIRQVTVVHQEIRIPRTLGDFVVTKYDAYVNNAKLPDILVSIDDYSLDLYRVVHLILLREDVQRLAPIQENSSHEMDFALRPSNETAFPVVHFTRNAQYKIALTWDPPTMVEGMPVQFDFKIIDPYRPNSTLGSIPYGFSLLNDTDGVIFHQHEDASGPGKINVLLPNYTGPITISFDNLDNNTFANAQFSTTVVNSSSVPEFPFASLMLGILFALIISVQLIFKTHLQSLPH